jgi:hypothetical protein
VTNNYTHHYNYERPNQALSCGNQPPRVAFPQLPARPSIPLIVDPDAWLRMVDGRAYVRKVRTNGSVLVDEVPYYIAQDLAGQDVALRVEAATRAFVVAQGGPYGFSVCHSDVHVCQRHGPGPRSRL